MPYAYPAWPAYGQGSEFVFMKPGSTNWTLSKASVYDADSAWGYTMVQAYTNSVCSAVSTNL